MPSGEETHEYIVVRDGASRPETNGVDANDRPSADEDQSSTSRRKSGGKSGDALDRLRAMPVLREIPYYKGKELPPEKSIGSGRVQTRGASLLAMRGEVKNPPCSHCATGAGRFSQCIAHEDWFHGACATCQLATRGNLCTYRRKETLHIKPEDEANDQESEELNSIPRKDTPPRNGSVVDSKSQSRAASAPKYTAVEGALKLSTNGAAPKKRKRETLQSTAAYKPYVSPYLPAIPSGSIQKTVNGTTPTLYSTPQSSYLHSPYQSTPPAYADTPPINYIYQKKDIQESAKSPQVVSQKLAPKTSALPPTATFATYRPDPAIRRKDRKDSSDSKGSKGHHSRDRDATESLSPSAQLLQPYHFNAEDAPEASTTTSVPKTLVKHRAPIPQVPGFQAINVPLKSIEPPDPPLVDSLPRKEQKRIYGIIEGLQSGIRSCKQQAEDMQKQLNLLQAALGLDVEDDLDVTMNNE